MEKGWDGMGLDLRSLPTSKQIIPLTIIQMSPVIPSAGREGTAPLRFMGMSQKEGRQDAGKQHQSCRCAVIFGGRAALEELVGGKTEVLEVVL